MNAFEMTKEEGNHISRVFNINVQLTLLVANVKKVKELSTSYFSEAEKIYTKLVQCKIWLGGIVDLWLACMSDKEKE